ncbi:PPK2 family polyphosphate kinase [Corynebacterium aquilae]|uniref:Polyphosphate kinase-2-related domain-containing protein n=1 Tax=Corynebacterium aquilae DSM 44791 TaxID=1431546 RepID=A0A1L7CG90_9CORY|nr:PPK2 family polyphosphate kinase [Corynebacterium aquilae]APT84845.1 hypothetical protein CAQU_06920 [Corynebacterium aquilae DSM 44791]
MANFSVDDARALAVGPQVVLADIDPASTPHFDGSKKKLTHEFTEIDEELDELQRKLYANARADMPNTGAVLLVLQGMDTSGKGGQVRHVFRAFDPQGVVHAAFGKPTEEEKAHDFLWRIAPKVPGPGMIGVFDRSHYEDVLIHRVRKLSPPEEIERRYGAINDFEAQLTQRGVKIIKVMLHISQQFQKQNLLERLEDPTKYWKYNPGDVDERALWEQYQQAYEIALRRTTTDYAPWYVVPSDNKPYARMVVKYLLLGALRDMDLDWPPAHFDVEEELHRVRNS